MRTVASLSLFLAVVGFSQSQTIDPSSVPLATRDSWCRDQQSSCPLLCLQQVDTATTRSNTCNPSTLAWTCVCSDGTSPNVSEYSQTVPFYQCTEWGNQCVLKCGQNSACASDCRENHPCGAQNPTRVNSTSASSMPQTATATGSGSAETSGFSSFGGSGSSSSGSSGSDSSSGGKSGASAVISLGQSYGLGLVSLGLFAGFAILL
jgi:uncharacterized membrane protein YgcG